MPAIPGPREILVQWIGVLAGGVGLAGLNASNGEFNGRSINQYRCSKFFHDDMIIRRFYVYETLIRHNFVVFQTTSGHTFKVHLIADVHPRRRYSPIYVEISPTYWRPDGRHVQRSRRRAWELKHFVQRELQKFGSYEVGINDCRHFARDVAVFLAN